MKTILKLRKKNQWVIVLGLSLMCLSTLSVTGCAGRSKTQTVSTVTEGGSGNTITTERQVSSEKTAPAETGVIGSTLHVVGVVLAYPFKLVAKIFEFIF